MIDHYVAGFHFNKEHSSVILIRKTHPKWQAGLLNGVGGHVEPSDKSTTDAMVREFLEETGIETPHYCWKQFARLQGSTHNSRRLVEFVVDWFWTTAPRELNTPTQTTDEKPDWFVIDELMACPGVMLPNLRWLIPLSINDIERRDSCSLFSITETERWTS